MKQLFVPYELAKIAKEKGFNEPCITRWGETSKKLYEQWKENINSSDAEDFTSAPLHQQLIDWFREEHQLFIEIRFVDDLIMYYALITNIKTNTEVYESLCHDNYFGRLELALEEAFKLI